MVSHDYESSYILTDCFPQLRVFNFNIFDKLVQKHVYPSVFGRKSVATCFPLFSNMSRNGKGIDSNFLNSFKAISSNFKFLGNT